MSCSSVSFELDVQASLLPENDDDLFSGSCELARHTLFSLVTQINWQLDREGNIEKAVLKDVKQDIIEVAEIINDSVSFIKTLPSVQVDILSSAGNTVSRLFDSIKKTCLTLSSAANGEIFALNILESEYSTK
jgi:hypothetical protein